MAEGGIRDYHQAKLKAAERLGILDDASLPRNREIEDALREYQRLFQRRRAGRRAARSAARPRCAHWSSSRRSNRAWSARCSTAPPMRTAPVALQLYSDDADAVPRFLDQHGIPAEARSRRLRLDRERSGDSRSGCSAPRSWPST